MVVFRSRIRNNIRNILHSPGVKNKNMKKVLKISLLVVCLVGLVAGVAITFTIGWRPFLGPRARPLTNRRFESTPERMARGQYLVRGVLACLACHSEYDWKAPTGPALRGKEGGGQVFPDEGLPGVIVASNITSDSETGAGNWTDDQLARAIREGIGHDGRALFPIMPYENFRQLPDEDLASVVVYLRSLPAARHSLPKTEIIFPVKYLIRSVPRPLTSPVGEPRFPTLESRGAYLASLALCADCHTPSDKGRPLPGRDFGGGQKFTGPWGTITSANITPDPSGISYYDEKLFLQAMRTGQVGARTLSPLMPWNTYRNMTDDDLKAIFAYLRTVTPVHNDVNNTRQASNE
jgi:mono/diheme cytochrome c family protein